MKSGWDVYSFFEDIAVWVRTIQDNMYLPFVQEKKNPGIPIKQPLYTGWCSSWSFPPPNVSNRLTLTTRITNWLPVRGYKRK